MADTTTTQAAQRRGHTFKRAAAPAALAIALAIVAARCTSGGTGSVSAEALGSQERSQATGSGRPAPSDALGGDVLGAGTGSQITSATDDRDVLIAAPTVYLLDDAGLGTGDACHGIDSRDLERPGRPALARVEPVDRPTSLFRSTFEGMSLEPFSTLGGRWLTYGGALRQLDSCGFDYTALIEDHIVSSFRWEATFEAIDGANQGGLLINQSGPETRSGAFVVDLTDGGSTLRWGSYDDAGHHRTLGSVEIDDDGSPTNLAVEADGGIVRIILDGRIVEVTSTPDVGGMVGLIASQSAVAFTEATLTALPPGHLERT